MNWFYEPKFSSFFLSSFGIDYPVHLTINGAGSDIKKDYSDSIGMEYETENGRNGETERVRRSGYQMIIRPLK